MRGIIALVLLAMLTGCGDRRDFDERYRDSSANIQKRAAHLDSELNAAQNKEHDYAQEAAERP